VQAEKGRGEGEFEFEFELSLSLTYFFSLDFLVFLGQHLFVLSTDCQLNLYKPLGFL
jgi:hypothetical protein